MLHRNALVFSRSEGRNFLIDVILKVSKFSVMIRTEIIIMEITTAEKSFMCHSNFTQGSHVVEVDDAF